MAIRRPDILKSVTLAAFLATAPAAVFTVLPQPAHAATGLPAPYVSRALDAVLLPVDTAVIDAFGLAPAARGVLVLATQPGGLADQSGILPGDVLDFVRGAEILSPRDLDAIVYNWLVQGITDFAFDGTRAGVAFASVTIITMEFWEETIEITEISSWSSYSYESFSYEEFTTEYSEEITESYEESYEITEESTEEVTEETTEEVTEESTEETISEDATVEESVDESAEEEPVDEEPVDEEPVDEGGDEGGGEEAIE